MTARRDYVWSVDVAMSKLAFAFAPLAWTSIEVECLHIDGEIADGHRLGLLDRQVRIYCDQVKRTFPPACAFVEQPSGRFPKPQLSYAAGVVQAALSEALGCPVWTITSGDWKKRTVGTGNATKSQVGAWVRRQCPDIWDQDACDAYAIAYAAREKITIIDAEIAA